MNINSVFSWIQGIVKVKGNSDNTLIGNVGDRFKVDSISSNNTTGNYVDTNKMYSLAIDVVMTSAGVNNPLILFRNPLGSGKKAQIFSIHCNNAITNVGALFRVFTSNTIITNGTAITPLVRNVNNGQPASVMLTNSSPTATLATSATHANFIGQNTTGLNILENTPIILQPDANLILTGDPTSNNRNSSLTLVWAEL
jgi:hypothetical protein